MNTSLSELGGSQRDGRPAATTTVVEPPSRWKTRILLPGAILATVLLLLAITSARTLLPATPVRVVPVVIRSVEGVAGTVTVQAPGWLEPDPHPYYVAALAEGVVESILVLEGNRVEEGQVVARLIDDDARLALQRTKAELLQSRARLHAAEADATAARLDLEHLVEPSRAVAVAEAAVAEARAGMKGVRADLAVERATLAEMADEYERKSKLTESGAVSEGTVARLRLRLDGERAQVEAVEAREAARQAKLVEAEANLSAAARNRELLIAERRAAALAEAAVVNAQASVALSETVRDEAALRLGRMQVHSPVNGIVLRRLATPGSKMVLGGTEHSNHIVHVYDPDHMQVRVDVPLADAAHIAVGQRAEIIVEVLPDRTFTGTITRLVHQADIQKNTVEVKVAIDNPSPELKPEMLARVRFMAEQASSGGSTRQRVFAPYALVHGEGGDAMALIVTSLIDQRGRVERRSITAGARRIDDWIEVESGLSAGDLLIADPPDGLEPGDRVRVIGEGG